MTQKANAENGKQLIRLCIYLLVFALFSVV